MKLVPALNLSLAALATVLTASAQDGLPVADLHEVLREPCPSMVARRPP